jgi:HAD superfamily phosphoserine phosphatase-like hydrolase
METLRAIIFDVDGTLSPEISWTALTRDLGASVEDHSALYQQYKAGQVDYAESKKQLIDLWRATGNANKNHFLSLFEAWPLAPEAPNIIENLAKKYSICLITGSMDLYAQTVAQKLHVTDYYANTTLHWDEAGNLTDMDYELDQAKRKLEQFLAYCSLCAITPEECVVVGDSDNDIALFEASGRGVAIGSEIPGSLRQVSWRTIQILDELPAIVNS